MVLLVRLIDVWNLKNFRISGIIGIGRFKMTEVKVPDIGNLPIDPLPSASALAKAASNLSDIF